MTAVKSLNTCEVFMPGSKVNIGNAGAKKKKSKGGSVMKKSKGGSVMRMSKKKDIGM